MNEMDVRESTPGQSSDGEATRSAVLELTGITKTYGSVHALDGVDLSVGRCERVALIGPSGSGKSTLLNLACGLDEPTSGVVKVDGIALSVLDDDKRTRLRREKIGMVFQTFNLLPTLTALENVSLPLRLGGAGGRNAGKQAREMLGAVGLGPRAGHRPDALSGGERQRVAIARALVFQPPLLLADEPTGNLDSETGEEILSLLDDLNYDLGTTVVMVTHNQAATAHCQRVLTLRDGKIVDEAESAFLAGPGAGRGDLI